MPGLLAIILSMTMVMITAIAIVKETERGTMEMLIATPVRPLEVMVGKLIELARDRGATPLQRDAIAQEWIELQALRYTAYR